jgi:hypothetical protein
MSTSQIPMKPFNCILDTLNSETIHLATQIRNMMTKESTVYKCHDYIMSSRIEKQCLPQMQSDPDQDFIVDQLCRQKMCEWSYRIVDHFNGSRELVAIAQNYVDRFLDQYRWCVGGDDMIRRTTYISYDDYISH